MQVSECMTRNIEVVDPNTSLRDAARTMARIDTGVLPVGENDRLVGMITDRDIAVRAVAEGHGPDARVAEVMSPDVKYCFEDADADEVLDNMGQLQLRRMPVVDHDKRLVGIVSIGDLAKEEQGETGEALSQIAQPGGAHAT